MTLARSEKLTFGGAGGETLAARLDLPDTGEPRAYALFAHCFTCSKDIHAARRVSQALAAEGFGVLRFDFTGLGSSDGDFANTHFSSNVADLLAAARFMRETGRPLSLLVGHSLGGAAVVAAAGDLDEVKGVATIGAPADVAHVLHNFEADLPRIEADGVAQVTLGGRPFTIRRDFVEDARQQALTDRAAKLRRALLVLHSPTDATVGVENARALFEAAKHPKSFVSLDGASHLLDDPADAAFAGGLIAKWADRYIMAKLEEDVSEAVPAFPKADEGAVAVLETGNGIFQLAVAAGPHQSLADEPVRVGGGGTGPTPYDHVSIGLAACTAMTLRLYIRRKKWDVGPIEVRVTHGKVHADDCAVCVEQGKTGRIDRFHRSLILPDGLDQAQRERLVEIADKCPVHRTLEASSVVETVLVG